MKNLLGALGLTAFFLMAMSLSGYATLDGGNIQVEFDKDESRGTDKAGQARSGPGIHGDFGDSGVWQEAMKQATDEELDEIMEALLNPDVSLEDAIMGLLMRIASSMDEKIHEQAKKIADLEAGKGPESNQKPNLDEETLKLKRLNDRRGQLFDTVKQTIDKFEEQSKGAIQSLRN